MSNLSTLPKGDSAWLLRKAIERIIQQVSVLETNIGSSTTGNSANTQVIFNDNGTLRGDPDLIFNTALNRLIATNLESTAALTVGTSATITGDLTVKTNVLKVDTTNNRVGIGTATPDSLLQMAGAGTINWKLSNTSDSVTVGCYAGTNAATTGTLSNHPFFLYTNNTERYRLASDGVATWSNVGGVAGTAMTLNSTGLGVGVASPSYKVDISGVARVNSGGDGLFISSAAGPDLYVVGTNYYNNNGTEGVQTVARPSWKIEHKNSSDALAYLDIGFRVASAAASAFTSRFKIDGSGNVGVGVTPAGTGGCLQLKSGITFPATQVASSDANTLDDYEEGTFTPTIVGTTTAGTGTYNTQRGDYIKIGRLVTAQFYIAWTAHTGTGNMNVSGLPFTTQNIGTYLAAASIGFVDSISMTAGNIMTGYAGPNSTTMFLKQTPTGGGASTDIPIDTSGSIIVTLNYIANA